MKLQWLRDKVIVLTGASSGIGKRAVEAFLLEGSKVVLAARSEEDMQAHLHEMGVGDDQAIVVKTDVSDYGQLEHLARRALDQFGRIDVWINNAAVSVYGPLDEQTPEEISRVLDVTLKGQMYGSKVALKVFKEADCGNIINVSSALGQGSAPLQTAYVAAKHGIVGFSAALREELMAEGRHEIDVSVVLPSSIDTPLFQHARSKLGVMPRPIPPVYHPDEVALALLNCAMNPKPEVTVGKSGKAMVLSGRWMPRLLENYMGRTGVPAQITDIPKPVEGDDNLFAPMPGSNHVRGYYGTTGDHMRELPKQHPVQSAVVLSIPLLLGWLLLRRVRPAV